MEHLIDEFVKRWQEKQDAYMQERGYNWTETYSVMYGKKYARIVLDNGGQRSAAAFVDLSNGDVLKTASWASPAKKARGNVSSPDYGMEAIDNQCFVKYLR